jgi:hypothetical protein
MTPLMGIWVGNPRVLSIGVVFLDTGLDVMLCLREGGIRGRDHKIVGVTTTYAISPYYHQSFEF